MASINSLQLLQNPPPLISLISDAEESDAIRSDTCVALMQPCFEEVVFENGEHLIRWIHARPSPFLVSARRHLVYGAATPVSTNAREHCVRWE